MKSFLDHLKEEVLPSVQVADGGLDISKPAVRAAINAAIAGVVSQPAVTPYVVFNRLSKLLAQYHIVLPKRFLEGDKGVEVFELKQFGHKMGMTDSGEFVNEVPATHYLFLQYGILSPFGITYAKPVVGGMFKVMARLVDKEELDKLMDMAEITMAEEAEQMQAIAKANAPKEGMHTALGDCDCSQGDSPSTKKAVKVSMKKIDEEYEKVEAGVKKRRGETHTLHRRNPGHKTEYHTITTERDGRKSVKTGSPKYIKKHWDRMEEATDKDRDLSKLASAAISKGQAVKKLPAGRAQNAVLPKGMAKGANIEKGRWSGHGSFSEEQIDTLASYIKKAHVSRLKAASQGEIAYANKDKAGLRAANKTGEKREQDIERAAGKLAREETLDEGGMPRSVIASKQKYAEMSDKDFVEKHGHKSEKELRDMAARHGYGFDKATKTGSDHYVKRVSSAKQMEEAYGVYRKGGSIGEKAPPGAKFERMVKHIKKGYAKDGLTAKEKGIAFATAWKAKNREKGE